MSTFNYLLLMSLFQKGKQKNNKAKTNIVLVHKRKFSKIKLNYKSLLNFQLCFKLIYCL